MTTAPRPPEGDWLGTPFLEFQRHGPFAHLVVNRPAAKNALTPAMYYGVRLAVRRMENDDSLAGMIITGTGDVFVPGGDLSASGEDSWMDFSALMMDATPFDTLRQAAKPVVVAANGLTQGGGFMISLCSDVAVAVEGATFRVPELLRGIADTYFSHMLLATVGPVRTRDLMFTGRVLTAQEALDWGLIGRVVAPSDLMSTATEVLTQVCRTAPQARNAVKLTVDRHIGLFDRGAMLASMRGPETAEGFRAFKARETPSWVAAELSTGERL